MITGIKRAFSVFDFFKKIDPKSVCAAVQKPLKWLCFRITRSRAQDSCGALTNPWVTSHPRVVVTLHSGGTIQLTTVAQAITLPKRAGLSIHMLFDPGTAETKSNASKDPSSANDVNGDDGCEDGICIGGVYCGKEIGNNLLAEMLTERRYVIRQRIDPSYARRIGEVCGGDQYGGGKSFQATKPNGDHVAIRKSLKAAARTLIQA
jgi:hypothetical protein